MAVLRPAATIPCLPSARIGVSLLCTRVNAAAAERVTRPGGWTSLRIAAVKREYIAGLCFPRLSGLCSRVRVNGRDRLAKGRLGRETERSAGQQGGAGRAQEALSAPLATHGG